MKALSATQPSATEDNPEKCQVGDKTAKRRFRSAENTTAYWRGRLFRNSFKDRQGRTVTIPEWYCRLRHAGVIIRHGNIDPNPERRELSLQNAGDIFHVTR